VFGAISWAGAAGKDVGTRRVRRMRKSERAALFMPVEEAREPNKV
jgi:hypothetical protein